MADRRSVRRRVRGRLEDQVVAALAAAEEALTPRELRDQLAGELAYTTVGATLTRLYAKGILTRERTGGRGYAYTLITPEARTARSMTEALHSSPDRYLTLARFVDTLAPDDIPLLRRLLTEREDGPG